MRGKENDCRLGSLISIDPHIPINIHVHKHAL